MKQIYLILYYSIAQFLPMQPMLGNDVWIGTRVIILPGVKVGSHSIIIAGVPAKLIRGRDS